MPAAALSKPQFEVHILVVMKTWSLGSPESATALHSQEAHLEWTTLCCSS
jgi:hypothetical protein